MREPSTESSLIRSRLLRGQPEDGALFIGHPVSGLMVVRLDGYAICPIEKLEQMAASLRPGVVSDEPAFPV